MVIQKAEMFRVIHEEREFSDRFVAHMLKRNVRIEEDLVDQLFNSSEKRLARALLLIARYGNNEKPQEILAKVSQETLAEMIGTTRSRVSFFMNKFRKLGFIRYNGHLEVHSSLLTVVLNDMPPGQNSQKPALPIIETILKPVIPIIGAIKRRLAVG